MGVRVPPFAFSTSHFPLNLLYSCLMDCYGYNTAASYRMVDLHQNLKGQYEIERLHNVLHQKHQENGDIFYFPYGSVVFWNVKENIQKEILESLKEFEEQPLDKIEFDEFEVQFGDKAKVYDDMMTLPNEKRETKLALSHGIAQSVKLGAFEEALANTFEKNRSIPEDLAKHGKISLSRNEIRKKMGQLFIERSSINLHVDILDTPDFFWDHPHLESLYEMIASELEIETRGEMLNQRLDVIKELFEMLGNEVNHQHSSRLEWIIIWLILLEVLLSLMTIFKIL